MRRYALALLAATAGSAQAAQFSLSGFADLRFGAATQSDESWRNGGLGKLQLGHGDNGRPFVSGIAQGTVLITPELLTSVVARVDPSQSPGADLLEAYVRYRPVSTTPWRWSIKAGAFFAPFSLENTEIGWAPYWTLTPSAINSWFGEEFRTIGAESSMEWRDEAGTLVATGALFALNQPAGVMIARRGWALNDSVTGLFQELRDPDATLILRHETPPDTTPIFDQYDGHVGWYAGASWRDADGWRLDAYRYDNEADPSAHSDDYFGWRTKFWSFGGSAQWNEFTLLAQGVIGDTLVIPSAHFRSATDYDSAFVLLGWERDDWRLALRAEDFHTRSHSNSGPSPATSETGTALTASAGWLPVDWLKITGEVIQLSSRRQERTISALSPTQDQTQFELSFRVYLD